MNFYHNAHIAFATKHQKELAVEPSFHTLLGARITVAALDTDLFGTFSHERAREDNALNTAEKKARLGMKELNLPYGLASEGSFGPHPYLPFASLSQELLYFIDEVHGFKLHETYTTSTTNLNHTTISNYEELGPFLKSVDFPGHALILRPNVWNDKNIIFKGIDSEETLRKAFNECIHTSDDMAVRIETDMRAHKNPTRMEQIRIVAERLALRLSRHCPTCGVPGWGVVAPGSTLPCSDCGGPSTIPGGQIYGCVKCRYTEQKERDDGKEYAESMYCTLCNP